jgi:hypothetical protein
VEVWHFEEWVNLRGSKQESPLPFFWRDTNYLRLYSTDMKQNSVRWFFVHHSVD